MKPSSLNVLVIDENRIRASVIEDGLRDAGYVQVTIIADMNGLARKITEIDPDVIVIDLENPNRDMLESMFQISRAVKRPIAMFVDKSDEASIEAAVDAGVSAVRRSVAGQRDTVQSTSASRAESPLAHQSRQCPHRAPQLQDRGRECGRSRG